MTFDGHAVQRSCRSKQQTVASAEDGCHDQGIDQMRQSVDLESLHCNHIGSGALSGTVEFLVKGTYDAAPVPEPDISPPRMPRRVESLYGMTMPMQRDEPTKNRSIRQTNERKAGGRILRGFSVSAATMEMYSGPHILSAELVLCVLKRKY